MGTFEKTVSELVELVGEEHATNLIAEVVDGLKQGRRPYDEVLLFVRREAEHKGDAEAVREVDRSRRFLQAGPVQEAQARSKDSSGRPSRVAFYVDLYNKADDKDGALALAQSQLSQVSFWRLRKELGLV